MKEIYLYNPIYSFVAEELISQINENKDSEITMRLNSPGGSVFSGWGICAKMAEHGNVTIKIDGYAASMGAFMLLFANKVECTDVARIMLHRADAYAETDEQKAFLASVNKDLRVKLEKKVKPEMFAEVTGVSFDEMFSAEKRIDVWIDAKQAKKLGLVDKINKLNPKELKAVNSAMMNIAATLTSEENVKPINHIKMNIENLKAEYPAVFAQVFALGVDAEKDRVQAWLTYVDVDAKTVKEGIEGKEAPTLKIQAELNRKAFSLEALGKLEEGNPAPVDPAKPKDAEAKTDVEKLEAEVDKLLTVK